MQPDQNPEANHDHSVRLALRDLRGLILSAREQSALRMSIGPRGGGTYVLEIESRNGCDARELSLQESAPLLRALRLLARGSADAPALASCVVEKHLPVDGGIDVQIEYREHSIGHTGVVWFDGAEQADLLSGRNFNPSRTYRARGALAILDRLLSEAARWNAPRVLLLRRGDSMHAFCRVPAAASEELEFAQLSRVEADMFREILVRLLDKPARSAQRFAAFQGEFSRFVGRGPFCRPFRIAVTSKDDGSVELALSPDASKRKGASE